LSADLFLGLLLGDAPRRRGIQDFGQVRQPLSLEGGLVAHDVVDAGASPVDRLHGGRHCVADVNKRVPAGSLADNRQVARLDPCCPFSTRPDRCAFTVEKTVSKDDAFDPRCAQHQCLGRDVRLYVASDRLRGVQVQG
jgi:hypothetical protein